MQEHLASAIGTQETTGIFEATRPPPTSSLPVRARHRPSGKTEAATWQALLALPPVAVNWTGAGPQG
jgi:hypothetical protein